MFECHRSTISSTVFHVSFQLYSLYLIHVQCIVYHCVSLYNVHHDTTPKFTTEYSFEFLRSLIYRCSHCHSAFGNDRTFYLEDGLPFCKKGKIHIFKDFTLSIPGSEIVSQCTISTSGYLINVEFFLEFVFKLFRYKYIFCL